MLPAMEYAQRSDPGLDPDKQVNEDACTRRETRLGHLCVVCDGMGGHASGREAAELAISTIVETFDRVAEGATPAETLRTAIGDANRAVHTMHSSEVAFGRPGCTVVAILMHPHGTEVAHVGDSRAYLVHDGQVTRVTRDHSIVQELVDRGLITAQQAARHPDANRITRALGMALAVEAELRPSPVAHLAGDSFVLCSDGLTDLVEDEEILAIVEGDSPTDAVGKLVDLANARGGHDNITVIVMRARESALGGAASTVRTVAKTDPDFEVAGTTTASSSADVSPPVKTHLPAADPPQAAVSTRPLEPAATAGRPALLPSKPSALVLSGLVSAIFGVGFLGFALVSHLREREGVGRKTGPVPPFVPVLVASDAGDPTPVRLTPEAVVVPQATSPAADPVAPLAPSIPKSKRRRP
jgi:protein phosphatase